MWCRIPKRIHIFLDLEPTLWFIVNSLILIVNEQNLLADSSIVFLGPKKAVKEKNRRVFLVCFGLRRLM
jgi:hypothetical protein